MKTIFDRIIQFQFLSHPAGGWLKASSAAKGKRKAKKGGSKSVLTPDSFNSRGVFKKDEGPRYNPAP